jgi:hypothetical protein
MPEVEVEQNEEQPKKLDKVKGVIKRNWKPFAIGAGTIIVIYIVTKRVDTRYLSGTIRTALLANKVTVKDQGVLLIQTFERWKGAPGWMVRCVETGQVFTSQTAAARHVGVDASTLSKHVRGLTEHAGGYHFVRVAMAIPRNG